MIDSEPLELSALNDRVGSSSSSVIVAVTWCGLEAMPLVTLEISTMIVSTASFNVSSTAVSVIEPVVLPAGMTIEVPELV